MRHSLGVPRMVPSMGTASSYPSKPRTASCDRRIQSQILSPRSPSLLGDLGQISRVNITFPSVETT